MSIPVHSSSRIPTWRRSTPEIFWISLPLSVLIHLATVTGLLIWLAQEQEAGMEPAPLTVTLLPAEVSGDSADPNAHEPPTPAGAKATGDTGGERPKQSEPMISPGGSPEPPPRHLARRVLTAKLPRPPVRQIHQSPLAQDAIPTKPSPPIAGDRLSKSDAQSATLVPAGLGDFPQARIQAQIAAIEAAYLADVRDAIEAARYYPRRARRAGQQGTVALRFEILSDGRIHKAQVQKSSGSQTLDSAALHILDRVGRFAPLPEELDRLSLAIRLPVDYHLDR